MPTYEYQCGRCGHRFDLFQKITDPPRKRCPRCRGSVRRLIGAGAGLIFKGSGFHTTDYRSKDYQEKAKSEKQPGTGDAKGEGKGKPEQAAPAEAKPAKQQPTKKP